MYNAAALTEALKKKRKGASLRTSLRAHLTMKKSV
jgi:hypothetical protein